MRKLFAVMLLVSMPFAALAQDARQWLEKMGQAVHELDYAGTFIYRHNGDMETMRIYHAGGDDGRQRLITLSGPSREVLRDGEKLTCILPDDESVVVDAAGPASPFPLNLTDGIEQLEPHYRLSIDGNGRVAGQSAVRLLVEPRDRFRYGYRLWLAVDSGLPLRSELLNERGRAVEQLMFTELKVYEQLPEQLLEPETEGKGLTWHRVASPESDETDSAWAVTDVPDGFHQQMRRSHFLPAVEKPVEHLVFSDGLASFSVYIEKRPEVTDDLRGVSRMGAVHATGQRIGEHYITVIGEVPSETVRRVADSVQFLPENQQ